MAFRFELVRSHSLDGFAAQKQLILRARPVAEALAAVGLALPLGVSWGATIQVNSALDSSGDPSICTLRDAITSAVNDVAVAGCTAGAGADQITFSLAAGTVITLQAGLPEISSELSIDGGAGIVIERSPSAPSASFPILNARSFGGPTEFPLRLSNLTLRNGLLDYSGYGGGAGLRANALSSVTLTNVKFEGNAATSIYDSGGAEIADISGNVTLDHVSAIANVSNRNAGGVAIRRVLGAVVIRESTFSGNAATGSGGGLLIESIGGTATISRSEFTSNVAQRGAGLTITGAIPTTIDTTYVGNNLSDTSNGIYLQNSNAVSIVQSWIADNRVANIGNLPAAVAADSGTRDLRIIDSTLGPGPGTALYANNVGQILFENSTVSGHLDANVLAAITIVDAVPFTTQAEFRNSTITNNSRGIGSFTGQQTIVANNSILSGNPGGDAVGVGNVIANFSLLGVSVPHTGANNLTSDTPGLCPLAATYNPNRTAGPTSNPRSLPVHRPLQNSIAIDAGDPSFTGPPAQDQVGNARVRTGKSGTLRLDIGAVETLTPLVTVSDGSALEGTAAPNNVLFTVSLSESPDPGFDVGVDFRTLDGTAVAGSDFVARSGSLTFSANSNLISQVIAVPTIADNVVEPDEYFSLQLNNVSNALFAPGANNVTELLATGTIRADDLSEILINDTSIVEGGNALFTVSLSSPLPHSLTLSYITDGITATQDVDFPSSTGTITFAPGETSKTFSVPTIDDAVVEPSEQFRAVLTVVDGALFVRFDPSKFGIGIATILDNDSANLSIGNASTVEGGNALFTVSLSSPSANTVSVTYATSGGTAVSGTDFNATSGSLTFLPGETSKTISVQTIDDLLIEPTENFTVTLANPTNAAITQATGTGSIIDNDFGNAITVVGVGPVTTVYESASNCVVTLGVQGVVGLGAGTLALPNPGIPPLGQSMPYGMQQSELFTCVGGSVNVTVTWPGPFESHWKWGATAGAPTPHWYPIATTSMGPNTVRFTITDGGFGDNDLAANGRIVDPYAAAVPAAVPPVPAGGGWWSGLVAAISALLGAIGLGSLRRRRG